METNISKKLQIQEKNLGTRIALYVLALSLLMSFVKMIDDKGALAFFYFLIMPLFLFAVYKCTGYFFGKRWFSGLVTATFLFLIVADFTYPIKRFSDFCQSVRTGLYINAQIENVSGYFMENGGLGCDQGCRDALMFYGYGFVEVRLDKENYLKKTEEMVQSRRSDFAQSYPYFALATETGFYRLSLVPSEDDPRCEAFNKWLNIRDRSSLRDGGERSAKYKGKCIASELIDLPISKYAHSSKMSILASLGGMTEYHQSIKSIETDVVIGESIRYSYLPNSILQAHKQMGGQICPETIDQFKINEILLMQ